MRVELKVDSSSVEAMLKAYPREMGQALEEFVERQGRRIERASKQAMQLNNAGPNEARSRTGNLVRQIRFVTGSQLNGNFTGVVKAFAPYSSFVHGPPYDQPRQNKNGRMRKTNPFFTKAKGVADSFRGQDAERMLKDATRRLMQ